MDWLRRILNDVRGAVVSIEVILVAVVLLFGLLVAFSAVRDSVISELSDVSGGFQDVNQSFVVNGVTGTSAVVAGMDFLDGTDVADSADDLADEADNDLQFDVTPIEEFGAFDSLTFGHPYEVAARNLDSWRANLVIDEAETYTSTNPSLVTVTITDFSFFAGRAGGVVTPFVVKVGGDNDFEVVAIGDTLSVALLGAQTHDFSGTPSQVDLALGETLAFGFLDANADGSGSNHSVIRFDNSGSEIWYSGGPQNAESASVSINNAPTPGNRVLTNLRRNYQFQIGMDVPQ